jgi:LuxR family maltose regulon positive regulatory protein
LLKRLDQWAPLTLVVAPTGYGKTTLLCNWLQSCPIPNTWLTLNAEDSSLQQFLAYLVASMRRIFPSFGAEVLEQLTAPSLPPAAYIAQLFANACAAVEQEFILVLDDYQVIEEPAVHAFVTELLRRPPWQMHLVISTRRDPPLPLVAARAHGSLVEIRTNDLSFTAPETQQMMAGVSPQPIPDETINMLLQGTQGWVAGLHLARLYLRQQQDLASLPAALEGGTYFAMEYLATEVVAQLPKAIQAFLLQTSVLERVSGAACVAISAASIGLREAQATLRWLEANGVFAIALDRQPEWYQYHPMFRQLLHRQLHQEFGPSEIDALHRRASLWYAEQGLTEEAIRHALAAGDTADAVQIVARARPAVMNQEEWWRLEQWARLFPKEVVACEPELLVAQAWVARNQSQLPRMKSLVMQAAAAISAQRNDPLPPRRGRDAEQQLEGEIDLQRTFLCYWQGDMAAAMYYGVRGLALTPLDLCAVRNVALMFLCGAYQASGDLPGAYAVHEACLAGASTHGIICLRSFWLARAPIQAIAGDLPALAENVNRMLTLVQNLPWDAHTAVIHYYLASIHYYQDNLAGVEQTLAELLPRRYQAVPSIFIHSVFLLAATYQAQQRAPEANALITTALAFCSETGQVQLAAVVRAFEAELALRQGRSDDAGFLALELADTPLLPMPYCYSPYMTLAKLYLYQNTAASLQSAFDLLERLEQFLTSTHNVRFLMEALALKALAWQARGEQAAAVSTLAQAIRLAEPGGYIRIFADFGRQIDGLLAQVAAQGVAPLLVAAIRAAIDPATLQPVSPPQPSGPDASDASGASGATMASGPEGCGGADFATLLTFREQDVLQLLRQRLTNQEIAEALGISPQTVKRHASNVFRKLQVSNRREASAAAGRLNGAHAGKSEL